LENRHNFKRIVNFMSTTLQLINIFGDQELMAKVNAFMCIQDKYIYVTALTPKKHFFQCYIMDIPSIHNGRISPPPSRLKLFSRLSKNVVSNIVPFFSMKEGLCILRRINKKF